MDTPVLDGQGAAPVYDYRMYDRIWQRVSPDLVPYPELREEDRPAAVLGPAVPGRPPAEEDRCLGQGEDPVTAEDLRAFLTAELAESRCLRALARQIRRRDAAEALDRMAGEKRRGAGRLAAACYLMTGRRPDTAARVAPRRWDQLPQALGACWRQEAGGWRRYRQAARETGDPCLRSLLEELARQSMARAEELLALLGRVIC